VPNVKCTQNFSQSYFAFINAHLSKHQSLGDRGGFGPPNNPHFPQAFVALSSASGASISMQFKTATLSASALYFSKNSSAFSRFPWQRFHSSLHCLRAS
jgi:hypothetical protein